MVEKRDTSYISLLNVLSAVAVVIMHINGCYWDFAKERYWVTANILNSVCSFAVPVFFMISGATLMNYRERYTTRQFFHKRVQKAVIPYVFWSLVTLLFHIYPMRYIGVESVSVSFVLNGVLKNSLNSVYWFFTPLFGLYLAMPLFSAVPKDKRHSVFAYLILAGFLINSLIPFALKITGKPIAFGLTMDVMRSSLFFALVGYMLYEYPLNRRCRWALYALSVIGLLVYCVGTQVASFHEGKVSSFFKGMMAPHNILYPVGIFVFCREVGNRLMKTGIGKIVDFLKSYTFAVYLLHMFFILLIKLWIPFDTHSIIWRLGGVLIIFPLCIATTFLLRKIPFVRRLLP